MPSRDIVMAAAGVGGASASDPYFEYNTLLLTGDGTNGAQNNTFLDSSTNNFTITRNGNTTQGTFSPYGDLWSNYFDGSGDYLSAPANAAFSFGTGNYTIEGWMFPNSNADGGTLIGSYPGATQGNWLIWLAGGGKLQFYQWPDYGGGLTGTTTIPIGKWTHFAVTCSSNTTRIFVNGVQENAVTATFPVGLSTNIVTIGRYQADNASYFNGYISNLRVIKGTALYTSNFTPSTTPLTAVSGTSLLTCQSNRFKDNSSNNFTLTVNGNTSVQRFNPFNPTAPYSAATIGGSGYFDGSGDYLTTPNNAAFNFGTGDFTVEWWMYCSVPWTSMSNPGIAGQKAGDGTNGWQIYRNSDNNPTTVNIRITAELDYTSNATPTTATWEHWAVTRSGTTLRWYKNGELTNTFTGVSANVSDTTGAMNVGYTQTWGGFFNGYISNLRIVKGTALYTSNFTPSTTPLTAITNTSLLCNFTNAGIPDAAMMNDLETVGNAQVSTSVKKYGTGSILFGANANNYLVSQPTETGAFGTGDFTVEGWINITNLSEILSIAPIATYGNGGANGPLGNQTAWLLGIFGTSTLRFYRFDGSAETYYDATISISANTWYHIAACRSSGTLRFFLNGTQINSVSAGTNYSQVSGTNRYFVGIASGGAGGYSGYYRFPGYMDDVRITKGYARYTTNFTPPTAALPTY